MFHIAPKSAQNSVVRAGLLAAAMLTFAISGIHGANAAETAPKDPDLSISALLRDPETPVSGNPKGDVTIVAFFDYNCPFCMKVEPDLEKLVAGDKGIRLVYKDWPIFGPVSQYAAKVALAAHWQHKYRVVHNALMAFGQRKTSQQQVRDIAAKAGADIGQIDKDLVAHGPEITAILARNEKQADTMGFPGTPVFLVGPFVIAQAIDLPAFKKAVADARKKQKGG